MAKPMHLGRPTGVDSKQLWGRIEAAAIQRVADAGYTRATLKAIAEGAAVSSAAVRNRATCQHLARQPQGDSSGRFEGNRNV
jgi:hypothetical protein